MRRLGAPGARRTRFDPWDIDYIIERHKAGAKADVIARELRCSVGGLGSISLSAAGLIIIAFDRRPLGLDLGDSVLTGRALPRLAADEFRQIGSPFGNGLHQVDPSFTDA